ncbi:uncharacterized protein LOC110448785 isoform X1 [Mizuhopecten yessoensis]|uniref:uncharacterized protein LOC110448785 isoform X1 n=1 Tax=Mizuhopecten yessoensis TaxID=6573 RepID=UPI000B45A489|nr:uncharacterized protein LOC110448785 isoform X1 [Mizuhopecten yessoensis]
MADTEKTVTNGYVNYNGNGTLVQNGTINIEGLTDDTSSSDSKPDDADHVSISSAKRSSEGSLRGLPALPKDADPPALPSQPPRNVEKLPPRMRPKNMQNGPKFIPEKEITIPSDGNISGFSVEDMTTFLKHMGLSDRVVNHLNKKSVSGKRFSKFTDSELETIGINNPILRHFRDKSAVSSSKKRLPFML